MTNEISRSIASVDDRVRIANSLHQPIAAQDALAHHYAVEYDARRTKLFAMPERPRLGPSDGQLTWAAVCQTGMDLFRPLLIARSSSDAELASVLKAVLIPGRQYLFSLPPDLKSKLERSCSLHGEQSNLIYVLSRESFQPVVNILVQGSMTPDAKLRATIRARDGSAAAEAGTNWQGARFAEVFVQVAEGARRRGLGKSVLSAVCAQLFEMGRTPILLAGGENVASQRLATRLGFQDTGARELTGALQLR